MLREVARETEDLVHQAHEMPGHAARAGEMLLLEAPREIAVAVPPRQRLRQLLDEQRIEPQRLAHVAHRAARAITDDGRGERGAFARVLAVDVLDDFLAPLVLEVDVDVGRFVAFLRDEALEQHGAAIRVDLGDEQAVAHGGIGRRAAALAQDAVAARELHEIVHGQEIVFVGKLGDQYELLLDQRLRARRHAVGPALLRAREHQPAQPGRRCHARGHDFLGVFVAQFPEREGTALCDTHAFGQQRRRVEAAQLFERAQVALGIGGKARAQLLHRGVQADRAQRVGERLALRDVHLDPAAGDHRQAEPGGELVEAQVALLLVGAEQQFDPEPEPPGEQGAECLALALQGLDRGGARQPDRQAVARVHLEVAQLHRVFALGAAPARQRDQARELGVGTAVGRQQHQQQFAVEVELGADDQVQAVLARRHVGLDHAGQRALVGDRERAVALPRGLGDQLLGVRSATQEAEITDAVQFGVGHLRDAAGRYLYVYTVHKAFAAANR